MKKNIFILLAVALCLVVFVAVAKNTGTGKGQKAPDFKLTDLNGKQVSLSSFKGKGVVLNFWATWCPPCRAELPDFQKEHKAGKKYRVVTVNLREDKKTVQNFVKKGGYTFPVLLDSAGKVGNLYQVRGIPTTYFIDKNGIVREVVVGALSGPQLRQKIKKHLE